MNFFRIDIDRNLACLNEPVRALTFINCVLQTRLFVGGVLNTPPWFVCLLPHLDCIVIEQVSRLHLNQLKHSRASYHTSRLQCCCLDSASYPR